MNNFLALSGVTCVYAKSGSCPALHVPDSFHSGVVGAAVMQAAHGVFPSVCAHAVHPAV